MSNNMEEALNQAYRLTLKEAKLHSNNFEISDNLLSVNVRIRDPVAENEAVIRFESKEEGEINQFEEDLLVSLKTRRVSLDPQQMHALKPQIDYDIEQNVTIDDDLTVFELIRQGISPNTIIPSGELDRIEFKDEEQQGLIDLVESNDGSNTENHISTFVRTYKKEFRNGVYAEVILRFWRWYRLKKLLKSVVASRKLYVSELKLDTFQTWYRLIAPLQFFKARLKRRAFKVWHYKLKRENLLRKAKVSIEHSIMRVPIQKWIYLIRKRNAFRERVKTDNDRKSALRFKHSLLFWRNYTKFQKHKRLKLLPPDIEQEYIFPAWELFLEKEKQRKIFHIFLYNFFKYRMPLKKCFVIWRDKFHANESLEYKKYTFLRAKHKVLKSRTFSFMQRVLQLKIYMKVHGKRMIAKWYREYRFKHKEEILIAKLQYVDAMDKKRRVFDLLRKLVAIKKDYIMGNIINVCRSKKQYKRQKMIHVFHLISGSDIGLLYKSFFAFKHYVSMKRRYKEFLAHRALISMKGAFQLWRHSVNKTVLLDREVVRPVLYGSSGFCAEIDVNLPRISSMLRFYIEEIVVQNIEERPTWEDFKLLGRFMVDEKKRRENNSKRFNAVMKDKQQVQHQQYLDYHASFNTDHLYNVTLPYFKSEEQKKLLFSELILKNTEIWMNKQRFFDSIFLNFKIEKQLKQIRKKNPYFTLPKNLKRIIRNFGVGFNFDAYDDEGEDPSQENQQIIRYRPPPASQADFFFEFEVDTEVEDEIDNETVVRIVTVVRWQRKTQDEIKLIEAEKMKKKRLKSGKKRRKKKAKSAKVKEQISIDSSGVSQLLGMIDNQHQIIAKERSLEEEEQSQQREMALMADMDVYSRHQEMQFFKQAQSSFDERVSIIRNTNDGESLLKIINEQVKLTESNPLFELLARPPPQSLEDPQQTDPLMYGFSGYDSRQRSDILQFSMGLSEPDTDGILTDDEPMVAPESIVKFLNLNEKEFDEHFDLDKVEGEEHVSHVSDVSVTSLHVDVSTPNQPNVRTPDVGIGIGTNDKVKQPQLKNVNNNDEFLVLDVESHTPELLDVSQSELSVISRNSSGVALVGMSVNEMIHNDEMSKASELSEEAKERRRVLREKKKAMLLKRFDSAGSLYEESEDIVEQNIGSFDSIESLDSLSDSVFDVPHESEEHEDHEDEDDDGKRKGKMSVADRQRERRQKNFARRKSISNRDMVSSAEEIMRKHSTSFESETQNRRSSLFRSTDFEGTPIQSFTSEVDELKEFESVEEVSDVDFDELAEMKRRERDEQTKEWAGYAQEIRDDFKKKLDRKKAVAEEEIRKKQQALRRKQELEREQQQKRNNADFLRMERAEKAAKAREDEINRIVEEKRKKDELYAIFNDDRAEELAAKALKARLRNMKELKKRKEAEAAEYFEQVKRMEEETEAKLFNSSERLDTIAQANRQRIEEEENLANAEELILQQMMAAYEMQMEKSQEPEDEGLFGLVTSAVGGKKKTVEEKALSKMSKMLESSVSVAIDEHVASLAELGINLASGQPSLMTRERRMSLALPGKLIGDVTVTPLQNEAALKNLFLGTKSGNLRRHSVTGTVLEGHVYSFGNEFEPDETLSLTGKQWSSSIPVRMRMLIRQRLQHELEQRRRRELDKFTEEDYRKPVVHLEGIEVHAFGHRRGSYIASDNDLIALQVDTHITRVDVIPEEHSLSDVRSTNYDNESASMNDDIVEDLEGAVDLTTSFFDPASVSHHRRFSITESRRKERRPSFMNAPMDVNRRPSVMHQLDFDQLSEVSMSIISESDHLDTYRSDTECSVGELERIPVDVIDDMSDPETQAANVDLYQEHQTESDTEMVNELLSTTTSETEEDELITTPVVFTNVTSNQEPVIEVESPRPLTPRTALIMGFNGELSDNTPVHLVYDDGTPYNYEQIAEKEVVEPLKKSYVGASESVQDARSRRTRKKVEIFTDSISKNFVSPNKQPKLHPFSESRPKHHSLHVRDPGDRRKKLSYDSDGSETRLEEPILFHDEDTGKSVVLNEKLTDSMAASRDHRWRPTVPNITVDIAKPPVVSVALSESESELDFISHLSGVESAASVREQEPEPEPITDRPLEIQSVQFSKGAPKALGRVIRNGVAARKAVELLSVTPKNKRIRTGVPKADEIQLHGLDSETETDNESELDFVDLDSVELPDIDYGALNQGSVFNYIDKKVDYTPTTIDLDSLLPETDEDDWKSVVGASDAETVSTQWSDTMEDDMMLVNALKSVDPTPNISPIHSGRIRVGRPGSGITLKSIHKSKNDVSLPPIKLDVCPINPLEVNTEPDPAPVHRKTPRTPTPRKDVSPLTEEDEALLQLLRTPVIDCIVKETISLTPMARAMATAEKSRRKMQKEITNSDMPFDIAVMDEAFLMLLFFETCQQNQTSRAFLHSLLYARTNKPTKKRSKKDKTVVLPVPKLNLKTTGQTGASAAALVSSRLRNTMGSRVPYNSGSITYRTPRSHVVANIEEEKVDNLPQIDVKNTLIFHSLKQLASGVSDLCFPSIDVVSDSNFPNINAIAAYSLVALISELRSVSSKYTLVERSDKDEFILSDTFASVLTRAYKIFITHRSHSFEFDGLWKAYFSSRKDAVKAFIITSKQKKTVLKSRLNDLLKNMSNNKLESLV
ncbi:hypothetical protein PCE1_000256 [Barthelona sp. PCE]